MSNELNKRIKFNIQIIQCLKIGFLFYENAAKASLQSGFYVILIFMVLLAVSYAYSTVWVFCFIRVYFPSFITSLLK